MPRQPRVAFAGALYHATARGNDGMAIFRTDADRAHFLALLARAVERFGWRCHAYCLMDNHFHLVVETPQPNVSRGMQWLNGAYAQGFNRRYGRTGHLFGGRFHSVLIDGERQLAAVARYVVANPVRARICVDAARFVWSSYRATAGISQRPRFLTVRTVLRPFGSSVARARRAYREAVRDARPP